MPKTGLARNADRQDLSAPAHELPGALVRGLDRVRAAFGNRRSGRAETDPEPTFISDGAC